MSFYCCALFCSCSSECYVNYTFAPVCSAVKTPVFLQSPFHSATRFSVSSVPYINCHISIQAQTELLQCILLYVFENKLVFVLFITYWSLHYLITVFEPGLWQEPQLQPGHEKQKNTKPEKRETKCESDKNSKIIISIIGIHVSLCHSLNFSSHKKPEVSHFVSKMLSEWRGGAGSILWLFFKK